MSLHVDVLTGFVAKAALKICTGVVEALKAATSHLDWRVKSGFHVAEAWVKASDMRGRIVGIAAICGWIFHIVPVLLVERDLQECVLSLWDSGCAPLPGVDRKRLCCYL